MKVSIWLVWVAGSVDGDLVLDLVGLQGLEVGLDLVAVQGHEVVVELVDGHADVVGLHVVAAGLVATAAAGGQTQGHDPGQQKCQNTLFHVVSPLSTKKYCRALRFYTICTSHAYDNTARWTLQQIFRFLGLKNWKVFWLQGPSRDKIWRNCTKIEAVFAHFHDFTPRDGPRQKSIGKVIVFSGIRGGDMV